MAFFVGQKVVCIAATPARGPFGESFPSKDRVLTVRSIEPEPCIWDKTRHPQTLRFVEIVNSPMRYSEGFFECCFNGISFRPVVERKTDISIFLSLLNPSKKVDA